jgi:hypothetical protein
MLSISELPYREFEMVGLSKKDVLSFPPRSLIALLSGNRTSLIRFKNVCIGTSDNRLTLDGKLSLRKTPEDKLHLNFHPVNISPKNAFGLSPEEAASLANNKAGFIDKGIQVGDGKLKDVKIYLDKITNEYVAVNREIIKAPEQINNTHLTEKQKEDFKDGKSITIQGQNYQLNPNSEIGISHANGEDHTISMVRFKHSSYSRSELLVDLSLVAYGLESFVMIEHLSNLFPLAEKTKQQQFNNPRYWEAIQEASWELKRLHEDLKFKPAVIENAISQKLEAFGLLNTVHKTEEKKGFGRPFHFG